MKKRFRAAILAKRIGSREAPVATSTKTRAIAPHRPPQRQLRGCRRSADGHIRRPVLRSGAHPAASAQSNVVAELPPLGFNDWGYAACAEVAGVLEAEAAAIHGSAVPGSAPTPGSLQTLGYEYVNNDGCWNDLVGEGTTDRVEARLQSQEVRHLPRERRPPSRGLQRPKRPTSQRSDLRQPLRVPTEQHAAGRGGV